MAYLTQHTKAHKKAQSTAQPRTGQKRSPSNLDYNKLQPAGTNENQIAESKTNRPRQQDHTSSELIRIRQRHHPLEH